jgi:hypothetical protein
MATDSFGLKFMLHPFYKTRKTDIVIVARGLAAVANPPHVRSQIILVVDCWGAQLESDLFLSANDSIAGETP